MLKNKRILAIVPARGGSKGIPKKNIINVLGKPLIQYTLDAAKQSKYIDEIHVSTDCEEIASVVQNLGYEIKRLRSTELSGDYTKTIDVLYDVVENYARNKEKFDCILLLQPTQPLRTSQHIDEALELYFENGEKGLVSVSEVEQHPILIRTLSQSGELENLLNEGSTVRRQDLRKYYIVNGAIYINRTEDILNFVSLNDNKIPYIMDETYPNIDIDSYRDLKRFEVELRACQN